MGNIDRVKDSGKAEVCYELYIAHIDWSQGQYHIYCTYTDPILAFSPFSLAGDYCSIDILLNREEPSSPVVTHRNMQYPPLPPKKS